MVCHNEQPSLTSLIYESPDRCDRMENTYLSGDRNDKAQRDVNMVQKLLFGENAGMLSQAYRKNRVDFMVNK